MFARWGGLGNRDGPSPGWEDDTFRLDLSATPLPRWERLEVDGFKPWRRSHACLLPVPRRESLLLFGGGDGNIDMDDA